MSRADGEPSRSSEGPSFRALLALALAGGLAVASLWILVPFLPAVIWATMLVVTTWPMLRSVQRLLHGRRAAAVAVMSALMVIVVAIPVALAIGAIVSNADGIVETTRSVETFVLGEPPAWLARVPVAGEMLDSRWRELAADPELGKRLAPVAGVVTKWVLAQAATAGAMLVQVLLTMVLATILYARGEIAAVGVLRFARRISPESGEDSVRLAARAIRGVALGIVVTAVLQSLVGGLGLVLAGMPGAAMLTVLMFLLAVAQIGATPVVAGAAIWQFAHGNSGWGTTLAIWAVGVGMLDNIVRPFLIRRGVDLPLLLIFTGVVGGLFAFGLLGLFIGPVVLAVTWTLLQAWVAEKTDAPAHVDTGDAPPG